MSVAVSNQMLRGLIPREGISDLTRNPLGARIGGYADSNPPPSSVTQNHYTIEQPERYRADDEQIDRRDSGNVIAQERLPSLGWG
jgi:hypothetical protein